LSEVWRDFQLVNHAPRNQTISIVSTSSLLWKGVCWDGKLPRDAILMKNTLAFLTEY
uniref:Neur_chan_LBD domain-containing protein n=1 Tax=Haemonchus placei TaxID=6290 RepID=A0A0N4WCA0_HAEPC